MGKEPNGPVASADLFELVRETAAKAAAQSDPDVCLRLVRTGLIQMGFGRAGIWTIDRDDPRIFHGTWGTDWLGRELDEHGLVSPLRNFGGWEEIATGNQIVFSHLLAPTDLSVLPHAEIERSEGPPNTALVALRADGDLLGLMSVDMLPSEQPLEQRHATALGLLADQIAVAIARHRLVTDLRESNERLRNELREREPLAESLRHGEASFRLLFQSNPHPMWVYDLDTLRFLEVNDAAIAHYGYARDEFLRMAITEIRPPDEVTRILSLLEQNREGFSHRGYWRHLRKDGSQIDVEIASHSLAFADRRAALVVAFDITERQRAETALRDSEERFRFMVEATGDALYRRRSDRLSYDYLSPAIEGLTGFTVDEINEGGLARIIEYVVSPRGTILPPHSIDDPPHSIKGAYRYEYRIRTKQGERRWLADHFQPWRDSPGNETGTVGILSDVTENKLLEEQLRQAQKMEAVGQLAGGIAHDFNNLLTVITGYGEILRHQLPGASPQRDAVDQILAAGESAASLTRQLLAFSRRQIIAPRAIDLNDVVDQLGKMLRRVMGEDVAFTVALAPNLGLVRADPGQIEQVLMNLASNARDAMPRGGTFTIETANVDLDAAYIQRRAMSQPGPYVTLTVSDNGEGMDAAARAHIFEPFFTTKEVGKGTGLGLAAVFGIVTQSNGSIDVRSEPEQGTTFTIYLPRLTASRTPQPRSPGTELPPGTETILIVEDDDRLRALARVVLEGSGYTVLEAEGGEPALDVVDHHLGRIDLLLADVVMPGMSGRQVAERLRSRDPHLKVIFMSGYTNDTVVRHGVIEATVEFLQKPFTPAILAQKVRQVLDLQGH